MCYEHERREDEGGAQRAVDECFRTIDLPSQEILELDFVFEALAHSRRRYLLHSLHSERELTLQDVARQLVAWEQDIPKSTVRDYERDQVYSSLYHTHVPKLIDLDVIEFKEGDEEIIVPAANAVQVLAALEGVGASIDAAQESHARSEEE